MLWFICQSVNYFQNLRLRMLCDLCEITYRIVLFLYGKSGSHKIHDLLISCFLVVVFTVIAIALKIHYTKL